MEKIVAEGRLSLAEERVTSALGKRGGVLLCGPRGGTARAVASRVCGSTFLMDDDEGTGLLDAIIDQQTPVLVDGWQGNPQRWDALAQVVRKVGKPGCVVTVAEYDILRDPGYKVHACEFSCVRVGFPSSYDKGDSDGSFSIRRLFEAPGDDGLDGSGPAVSAGELARMIVGRRDRAREGEGHQCLEVCPQACLEDAAVFAQGPGEALAFGEAIACFVERPATNLELCRSITGTTDDGMRERFAKYQEKLCASFGLLERVNWKPTKLLESRTSYLVRRCFCDPSVAVAARRLDEARLGEMLRAKDDWARLLFKSLVVRDLGEYAASNGIAQFRYDDKDAKTIDCVLEYRGRWCGVMIELDPERVPQVASRLSATAAYLAKYRTPLSTSLMVVAGPGARGHWEGDVRVVPFDRLGA